jgi:AraC-like DNA-binding protein
MLPPHRNDGLELVYVTQGRVRWNIEGRHVDAAPETVTFTLPWQEHGVVGEIVPSTELYYLIIRMNRPYHAPTPNLRFHRALQLSPSDSRAISTRLLHAKTQLLPAGPLLPTFIREIVRNETIGGLAQRAYLASLVRLAVITLARSVTLADARTTQPHDDSAQLFVQQFIASLPDRCNEPWTLASMADACALGRTRFTQLFRRLTGDSPLVGLQRLRIERAQSLLLATNQPITRIAMNLGFTSSQYFSKVFKDFTGQSPSQFRQSLI